MCVDKIDFVVILFGLSLFDIWHLLHPLYQKLLVASLWCYEAALLTSSTLCYDLTLTCRRKLTPRGPIGISRKE